MLPPIRNKCVRIRTPEALIAAHGSIVELDDGIFGDVERVLAVGTSAEGEDGGLEADALV